MKQFFNSRAAGFSASQASVLVLGFAVTIGLGITGGALLIGQLAPLFLCQQVATGVLQQGLGDAGLYLASDAHNRKRSEAVTKRNVVLLAVLAAITTALVGTGLALSLGVRDAWALLFLAVAVLMTVVAEVLRLVLIWEGKIQHAWISSIGQAVVAIGVVLVAAVDRDLHTFALSLAVGTSALVCYELLAAKTLPYPKDLRIWLSDRGTAMKAAALDSAWGTAGLAVAQQLTGLVAGAAVLGEVRVAFQALSIMVFLGVVTRRMLISSDRSIQKVGPRVYVFFPSVALVLAFAAWLISLFVPALDFIPRLGILLAASAERALTSIQQIESGRLMKLGHIKQMLTIRRTGSIVVAAVLPAAAFFFGAVGFFTAGALIGVIRMLAYRRIS